MRSSRTASLPRIRSQKLLLGIAPLVRAHHLAPVEDADLVVDHAHGHRVARKTAARVVPGACEVDPAVDVHTADVVVLHVGDRLALLSAPVSGAA